MARAWTETEVAALDEVAAENGMAAYHAWGALTNYSKSFNAFEVKRRRLAAGSRRNEPVHGVPVHTDVVLVSRDAIADYVGFNVAFWDLETTFSTQPLVLYGGIANQFGQTIGFSKGKDITDDRELVRSIKEELEKYDIWVTWNGALFDIPVLNGRLMFHGFEPLRPTMHIDLMYKASGGSARIGRRSLQSVSEYFGVENRKTPLKVRDWDRAMAGSEEAYALIAEHCIADCLVTRDVFAVLKPQIRTIQR